MKQLIHTYDHIISTENLLLAWREFIRGKRRRLDVQDFNFRLMDNVLGLHEDLATGRYRHGGYEHFKINDPKLRDIHKASVRDRLVHHAIYRVLYFFFHPKFIADSYSCQLGKGTHRALKRFRRFAYQVGQNDTKTGWVLKCDIKKFFANIDHNILIGILDRHISDARIINLLKEIVNSFQTNSPSVGLPLGNLTSQLLVNIFMNEFDQFMKHQLKVKYYLRYTDDFVIMSSDRSWLEDLIPRIKQFLNNRLRLGLHPDKVFIKTLASGVDFLGWVHFPDHRVLRTVTKRRMLKRLRLNPKPETKQSYLGLLKWGNSNKLKRQINALIFETTKDFY